eukprot:NODE_2415_length_2217_cov_5.178469.p1 GENE.NODE_2415_length_2217_cov_5.178469~~NODE_2415_length_2217_cov_5.178469.p1  ORF type:complete len:590 (+),score=159.81 NODE_2415_length_2217_cov_5.178469:100-1869(+)
MCPMSGRTLGQIQAMLWDCCWTRCAVLLGCQPRRRRNGQAARRSAGLWVLTPAAHGRFFFRGGGEAVVAALWAASRCSDSVTPDNIVTVEELLTSIVKLISVLVDGNEQARQQLQSHGVFEALGACCRRSTSKACEEAMWVIGQIGGVTAVLEAMKQADVSLSSVRGGLLVLSELTWNPSEEALATYLEAAPVLFNIACACETWPAVSVLDKAHAAQALGGILHALAPHVAPSTWPTTDNCAKFLMSAVSPDRDEAVVQAAAECLGRIAAGSSVWRTAMCGVLTTLSARLRTPSERDRYLQKYLFWAAAAIAGLPIVLFEMQSQQQSPSVQDAAICSIIDILDDNLDGEYSLRAGRSGDGPDACEASHLPEAISTVIKAMQRHPAYLSVQFRGSHALGLLCGHLPTGSDVPLEAISTVLTALWRHPTEENVACGACRALRVFLEPRRDSEGGAAQGASAAAGATAVFRVVVQLRERDTGASLRQILDHFSEDTSCLELLEDASYVAGLVDGVQVVAQLLVSSDAQARPLRAGGLKALFELGRCFPELLSGPSGAAVAAAANELAASHGPDEAEIQRHAELLRGVLNQLQ